MDDRRIGLIFRALRRRLGLRQTDVAAAAGVSQATVSRMERGHLDTLPLATIRRLFGAVDARFEGEACWRGGELDRLMDAGHALLVGSAADLLERYGWRALQELTFSVYGERGSIDLVGVRERDAIAVAIEAKRELTSWEETQRRFDAKTRLLPAILHERLGWRPRQSGRILLFEESMTTRRRLASAGADVRHGYPAGSVEVRRWLRSPVGPLSGIWFLSPTHAQSVSGRPSGPHRVSRRCAAPAHAYASVDRASPDPPSHLAGRDSPARTPRLHP